jgi:hypothetical protein
MMRLWSCGWWVLFFIPTLQSAEKDAQKSVSKSVKVQGDNDDNFELCSRTLPLDLLRLIAQYCVGTKKDGVCPLFARALAWKRVIAHCSEDQSNLIISAHDDDPRFMMLCDYRHDATLPVINTFNFETGERILRDYKIVSGDSPVARTLLPRNGTLVRWTANRNDSTNDVVLTKHVDHILPSYQALDPEEYLLNPGGFDGATGISGQSQRYQSTMDLALLQQINGAFFVRWTLSKPSKVVQLHTDPTKALLDLRQDPHQKLWLISSDDRGCVGIVFPRQRQIVVFNGDTGNEQMRCAPPKGFSFMKGGIEQESYYFKIRSIPVSDEQKSRYELLALVEKCNLFSRENRYIRWDIEEKRKACDMQVYAGYAGNIRSGHILPSGAFMAMHHDTDSRVILCDPTTRSIRSLWDAGWWNEFEDDGYRMHAAQTGSHVLLYGCSNIIKPQDTSLRALYAMALHFDPTMLCASDVQGVTDDSLLQRIRLLHGLCLAASKNDPVTLTSRGKELFAQLHSHVRRNVQTTMFHHVYGWDDEPATVASRKPILPNFESLERKEQKLNDSSCRIQ